MFKKNRLRFVIIFLFSTAVGSIIFSGSVLMLSHKYDKSPLVTGKMLARHCVLSTYSFLIKIYDPYDSSLANWGPVDSFNDDQLKTYVRAEKYFNNNDHNKRYKRLDIHNEKIVKSRFDFNYQPFEEEFLLRLREKYKLADVIINSDSEFQEMVLLRNWARSQFDRGICHKQIDRFNALTFLSHKEKNIDCQKYPQGWTPGYYTPCHFYPLFFSQVMLAMGFQSRLVQISYTGYGGHGLTEVWSNQFKKWISMDADLNLHYEKKGVPLNLLEVHNERYEKKPYEIKIIRSQQTSDREYEKKLDINDMIPYHTRFMILDMRNDWMTNSYFKGHPQKSDYSSLIFTDTRLKPMFSFEPRVEPLLSFRPQTTRKEDFYWTLNQTEILIKKETKETDVLELAFNTVTPNFLNYEIIIDDSPPLFIENPEFQWALHKGVNKFSICSHNKFGRKGIVSHMTIGL